MDIGQWTLRLIMTRAKGLGQSFNPNMEEAFKNKDKL